VRSGSVSSTESPSVIAARQAHGIPKHAQERIEERQAKVNKGPSLVYPNVGESNQHYVLSEHRSEYTPPVGAVIPSRRAPTWVRRSARRRGEEDFMPRSIIPPPAKTSYSNVNYYYHIPTLGLTFSTVKVTPHVRLN